MADNQNTNKCVRVNRDAVQIERCRSFLNEKQNSLSQLAKLHSTIGNEVRLGIMYLLSSELRLCVCDMSEILDMTIPSISQHLKKLKQQDMVFTEREGNTIYHKMSLEHASYLNFIFSDIEAASELSYES